MKPHQRFVAIVSVGCCLTLISGLAVGYWSNRWGSADQVALAAAHLQAFPARVGEWRLFEESQIDSGTQSILECAGYVYRHYVNERSGAKVHVVIVVGPTGPISVHTPEICYSSRDYELFEPRQRIVLKGRNGSASFWQTTFKSRSAGGDLLRSYYAWSPGDRWDAPQNPRFEFAGSRVLFKLQLACELSSKKPEQKSDAGRSFLMALNESDWPLFRADPSQPESKTDGIR